MLKKISALSLGLAILFATSCSTGKQKEELADLVGNVFGVQSMAFMMMLYGMPVENAELAMNEDQTEATVTYTDYMVTDALAAMGAPAEQAEELPFEGMSGTVHVNEEGNMEFDLALIGSSYTTLVFTFHNDDQSISDLVADGKNYDITKVLEKMAEERMEEEQAAAEAAVPTEAPSVEGSAVEEPSVEGESTPVEEQAPTE
jgi:hypothetical protein